MFAIRALRELPGTETRVLLKEILGARTGLLLRKRESKEVRAVARETLAALGGRSGP